jgi:hypothetical protein
LNWGYVLTVAVSIGLLFILSQRVVQRHQKAMRRFTYFVMLLLLYRQNFVWENLTGFAVGSGIAFLFWLLIGRYNKVGDDDEESIKVYGMDD